MICVGTRVCHWSQGRLCCSTLWLWLWQSIFMHHLSSAVATGLFEKKTWLSDTPKRIYCKSGPCTYQIYHQPLDITFLIPMATRDRWKFKSLPHRHIDRSYHRLRQSLDIFQNCSYRKTPKCWWIPVDQLDSSAMLRISCHRPWLQKGHPEKCWNIRTTNGVIPFCWEQNYGNSIVCRYFFVIKTSES